MDPNFISIGLVFVLTAAAWKKWFGERVSLPRARIILFLAGLCAISIALTEFAAFIVHAHQIGGFGNNFAAMLSWARPGFFLALTALAFAATGRGASRILAVAASSVQLIVWVILVSGI